MRAATSLLSYSLDEQHKHEADKKTQAIESKQATHPVCEIKCDGKDIFVLIDGAPVAKRGKPGTRHAKKWISLQPGIAVRDVDGGNAIDVEFTRGTIH